MRRGLILLAACGLGGCAGAPRPMPLAESGPVEVVVAGQPYIADLQPGPVLTVSRAPAFGNAEGIAAKAVAEAFCASRSARLNGQTLGRFAGGSWVFEGGCA